MKQVGRALAQWRSGVNRWWRARGEDLSRRLPAPLGRREPGTLPQQPAAESGNGLASETGMAAPAAAAPLASLQPPSTGDCEGHRATQPQGARATAASLNGGLRASLRRTRSLLQRLAGALPGGARPWIALVSLGFVMAVLVANGRELLQLQLDGQGVLWLVLATGLTLASLVMNGLALGGVLRWLGGQPRWEATVSLFVASNLRKYLPGGIWHLAARVEALRGAQAPLEAPMSAGGALLATLLEPLLAATAALVLVAFGGWQNGLGLLGVLPLALLMPGRRRQWLPGLERQRARQLELANDLEQDPGQTLPLAGYPWQPLLLQLVFVLLRFSGFACCVWAFELQGIIPWTTWLAGFALAWTAGLVVPGAPGGLGVFETVLLLRLRVALPDAQLLAVALSYRLISTVADLFGAALVEVDQQLPLAFNRLAAGWSRGPRSGLASGPRRRLIGQAKDAAKHATNQATPGAASAIEPSQAIKGLPAGCPELEQRPSTPQQQQNQEPSGLRRLLSSAIPWRRKGPGPGGRERS